MYFNQEVSWKMEENVPGVSQDPICVLQASIDVEAGNVLGAIASIAGGSEDVTFSGHDAAACFPVVGGGVDSRGGGIVGGRGVDAGPGGHWVSCVG